MEEPKETTLSSFQVTLTTALMKGTPFYMLEDVSIDTMKLRQMVSVHTWVCLTYANFSAAAVYPLL